MTAATAPLASAPRLQLLTAWRALERGVDRLTGPALNPLHHLGSLGFLCFWSLAASGIYLYAVIDTSASGAHASIERLACPGSTAAGCAACTATPPTPWWY
ncbi:hypothetical protein ACFSTJ_06125 [Ottowia pentelensis]|uniref:hypothetical protein n=1 Tax=Ottowia pentelensis TaxID=511108 RepID=UPI0036383B06